MMEWIVTSSAMILIVIALRGLLKGKISLKLQYGLWALVLVRLLLPFSIVDSAISISNILSAPVIREADTAVSDYRSSYESLRDEYNQKSESVTDEEIRLQVQQELYDHAYTKLEQEYSHSGATVLQTQIQAEAQQQVQVISLTAVITEALPYLWVVGMVVASAVLIGSNIHFWWKLRQNRTALDIPGVPLKVYLTDYVATPCLFGLEKPDIYLTNEVMTDSQMRRHVLAHEMSHYRQGDHLWSVMRSLCLVLHWYNPLVWAAAILSKQDAELACDEATIKALGENERTAYGRTLIGMTCVRRDPRSLMLTATTMLGTKKTLKERISLIAKKPKTALYTLIACVLVAAIAVGCTFTGAPAQTEEEKLLDRCREAVEYIQNLEHFEITEHYEVLEEAEDYIVGPDTQDARYVHSGDDWYHFISYVDWTWQFLEKDGQQYRKDITNAVPEEDIPAIEWTKVDLSENYYAKHAWIMDIHWDEESIGYLTYTGNGDGYEGGSLTPISVTSETDGGADLIRVEFEVGPENMVNVEDAEGTIYIFTFRFDRETGIVTEVTREIVMEDREIHVAGLNGGTEYIDYRSTSTLSIQPGTEEEMSAIIDGIFYDEIVTVVPGPEDPTEPSHEEASLYLEKCRLALEELQNRDYVVLNEWKSTDDPDIMLAWLTAKYVHSGDDWAISKLMDPVTTFYYLEVDGVQYVRYQSEHPDTAYPDWTVADLSAPEHEFSDDCWILEYQWDPDTVTYQGFELWNGTEIITLNLFDADTSEITGVMELKIDKDGHLKNLSKVLYSYGPNGETCELTSEIEVYSTSENYCSGQIADYYYQTTPEYHYQVLLHEEWTYRIVGCVFEKPEDISLAYLFYRGLPVEEREDPSQYSQAEVDFLKSKLKDSFWGEEAWDDAFKFPADRLNEILNQYLGVSLDEVKIPNRWYYFSETDAYYDVRTDSYAARGITVTEVEVAENGNVLVHYKVEHLFNQMTDDFLADAEMVMTLQVLENGSHQILSNVIDPDSTYYLLYTSGLARLFQTGSPKVYIDNNKAKPIRIIPVNEEIVHGLMEHLNHYNWQKIDGPIQRAEKDPFREQIYFRNQGTFDQGVNLTLTVWEDGSYQLGYWDNLETTCYYLGTPKSDTYGSAAEDLRNFHETFWPETDE